MKKTIVFIGLLVLTTMVKAQTGFMGGGLTAIYYDSFVYQSTIHGGYEFNDKFAAIAMFGIAAVAEYGDDILLAESGVYLRYTPWHNKVLYLDFKPRVEVAFAKYIAAIDVGIVPSLRFRVSNRWEVFTDIGAFGVRYLDEEWRPHVGFTNMGATVGVNYRF